MTVTVPVFASQLKAGTTPECLKEIYKSTYTGGLVSYDDSVIASGMAAGNSLSGIDTMKIAVGGNDERILLISHFDNLGKGASGAAVQCLNLVLGQPMSYGLSV
jgi:N-acetyl-gamma-glutamyl-phosphate reductase